MNTAIRELKCGNCMESVKLVNVEGFFEEDEIWLMCECKGMKIGEKDKVNYPQNWKQVSDHT